MVANSNHQIHLKQRTLRRLMIVIMKNPSQLIFKKDQLIKMILTFLLRVQISNKPELLQKKERKKKEIQNKSSQSLKMLQFRKYKIISQ